MSPTQRTMAQLRKLGFRTAVVERFNSFANVRIDLFGCFDVIAINPKEKRIVGVQCGIGTHHQEHCRKIKVDNRRIAKDWVDSGGEIQVWSWRALANYNKDGSRSKRDKWEPIVEDITTEDF